MTRPEPFPAPSGHWWVSGRRFPTRQAAERWLDEQPDSSAPGTEAGREGSEETSPRTTEEAS